jgi:hypothetical protein
MICDRCNWLIGDGCTCRWAANAWLDVERRHREAVARAKTRDWAGNAGDRTRPRVIGAHFGRRRAA